MLQLKIEQCAPGDAEQISELLEEMGALSVTMTDKFDDAILEPELGTHPLWPQVTIHALYAEETEADLALKLVSTQYTYLVCAVNLLPEQDWQRVCMDDFKPLQFGSRLWICPSWLTPPEPDAVNLILDPGLAFGTGTHQTTSLCLTWLEQADLYNLNVIDFGCGSGILALAALKLGAKHAYAVDIDPQALIATENNAASNGIQSAQLTINLPDILAIKADLLIANILLSPLLTLKQRFRQLLTDKGRLVVSGILAEQIPDLIADYNNTFTHHETIVDDGWGLVVFTVSAL